MELQLLAYRQLQYEERVKLAVYEFTIDETKETLDSYFEYTPLLSFLSIKMWSVSIIFCQCLGEAVSQSLH